MQEPTGSPRGGATAAAIWTSSSAWGEPQSKRTAKARPWTLWGARLHGCTAAHRTTRPQIEMTLRQRHACSRECLGQTEGGESACLALCRLTGPGVAISAPHARRAASGVLFCAGKALHRLDRIQDPFVAAHDGPAHDGPARDGPVQEQDAGNGPCPCTLAVQPYGSAEQNHRHSNSLARPDPNATHATGQQTIA